MPIEATNSRVIEYLKLLSVVGDRAVNKGPHNSQPLVALGPPFPSTSDHGSSYGIVRLQH
jgi:hypothetical protein